MTMTCTLLEILENLPEWSIEEVQVNLNHVLSLLQSALNCSEDKVLSLRAVQMLLKNCLSYVTVTDVESKILRHALPAAKNLFREGLQAIETQLAVNSNTCFEEITENLTSLLQVCFELLNCLDISLVHIASFGKVSASDLRNTPETIMTILYDAFKHIKDSKTLYNNHFQPLGEELASMFRLSSKVQAGVFAVMMDNLQFDCGYEDDLEMLKACVELLGRTGELMVGLDVKTMADLWKGYLQLTQQYSVELGPRLDVATPIKFMARNICCTLESFGQIGEIESKTVSRSLKIGGFNLKVVIKLCESFAGYLGDCHKEFCRLLVSLHGYCRVYLETEPISGDILEDVERHLTIGADPLLATLMGDMEFIHQYFEMDMTKLQTENKRLGFLLFTVSIVKKLLQCDSTIRHMWQNNNRNVLSVIFKFLDDCHPEMCWPLSIPVPATGGEVPRRGDLYEMVLIHVAAYAVSSSAAEFPALEQFLLASVLQTNVWRALLATDVWCIMARYGSSELCLEQMLFLIEIHRCRPISGDISCPERCYLNELLSRLFLLLSDKSKAQLVTLFPLSENQLLWQILRVKHLPEKMQSSLAESAIVFANSHILDFFNRPASLESYYLMLSSLSGIISLHIESLDDIPSEEADALINNIVTLWQHSALPQVLSSEETSQKGSQWLNCLLYMLTAVTSCLIVFMNNSQILQVVQGMESIVQCSSSSLKVSVISVLRSLAAKPIEPSAEQSLVCQRIASLFTMLLQDENPLIRQTTLEAFAYFAYVTQHEEIVRLAVSNSKELQCQMKAYLQRVQPPPAQKHHLLAVDTYLECQSRIKFQHKCADRKARADTDFIVKSVNECAKRTETSDKQVLVVLERMHSDASMLVTLSQGAPLDKLVMQQVAAIETQLKKIVSN